MAQASKLWKTFGNIASRIAHAAGRPVTFIACLAIVVAWGIAGPIFGFSNTWQLFINSGTTIVTFLMVFLIQNTQNRDGAAIQAKLDELIRVSAGQNTLVGIEHLSEEEVEAIRRKIEERAGREGIELDDQSADAATDRANRRAAEAVERATSGS